jgi:hypothetical protein
MKVIEQSLSAGFLQKTFSANSNGSEECYYPEKCIPGGLIQFSFKAEGADKNGPGEVNQHSAEGRLLPEFK